jgi:hypothetical protein
MKNAKKKSLKNQVEALEKLAGLSPLSEKEARGRNGGAKPGKHRHNGKGASSSGAVAARLGSGALVMMGGSGAVAFRGSGSLVAIGFGS